MSGSSNVYRGKYFMDEDVVLVTMNYRVGSLGTILVSSRNLLKSGSYAKRI